MSAVDMAGREAADSLPELSVVRVKIDIQDGDIRIPAGSIGAIVFVYPNGKGYEVEFTQPVQAVVGLEAGKVEPA